MSIETLAASLERLSATNGHGAAIRVEAQYEYVVRSNHQNIVTALKLLAAWRDAREAVFAEPVGRPDLWTALGHAEHALMKFSREAEECRA